MTLSPRTCLSMFVLTVSTLFAAAPPGVTLIGKGSISGSAADLSGLQGNICKLGADPNVTGNCVPKNLLGGLGSDLTYIGFDDVFIAAPDRGPFDGLTNVPYLNRFHFLHITVDALAAFPNIATKLLDTRFFKNEVNRTFIGSAGAFDVDPLASLRLDPEGIRVGFNGTFFISDEYGPYLFEFERQGHLVQRFAIPSKFPISNPAPDPVVEVTSNTTGRLANRGMEGLAITPDGRTLAGIMQSALIQDNGLNLGTPELDDRLGLTNRILKVDVATGATEEYVYVLDAISRGQGVSEILAINDHQFLVLERDNRSFLKPGDSQAPTPAGPGPTPGPQSFPQLC